MTVIAKVRLFKNSKHDELVYYFKDRSLVQPSLNITCSRAPFKLVLESNSIIKKYDNGEYPDEVIGTVTWLYGGDLIQNQPTHL